MKIVHLCLAGTISDGWSYQENLLAKYHAISGHEVSIITSEWMYNNGNKLVKSSNHNYFYGKLHIYRLKIKNRNKLSNKFKRYKGVIETLNSIKPDILFIHGCQFLDVDKICLYLKNNKNVRVYVDNHADFSNSATNFISKIILHKWIWKKRAKMLNPYTTKFYGVLPARVDFLKNIYNLPSEKIELLLMGGDDELIDSAKLNSSNSKIRSRFGIDNSDFLIVTGGKIDKYKKQTIQLMEAVKDIRNQNLKLIVFGSIEEFQTDVYNLIDNEKIFYAGWINSKESYEFFEQADLVVFPGRHSVYWEQVVSQGKPMIVKKWRGTQHIDIGGNVVYLETDSVDEIKDKIEIILNDSKKYCKMIQAANKNEKNNFKYSKIAKNSLNE